MKGYVITASLICLLALGFGCATTPNANSDTSSKNLAGKSSRLSPSPISKPASPLKEFIRTNSATSSPFSKYDASFEAAIKKIWYASLAGQKPPPKQKTGKVKLSFQLHSDGRITDMKVVENTASPELVEICQKAVMSGVPYPRWPDDMIRMVGANYRAVTFTFNYD